jgi:sporulation protein YlmC with PRC-barrel domain
MKPCGFVRGHRGLNKTNESNDALKKTFTMKTTNTLARRAALMTVLILGSSAWLSAQDTNEDRIEVLGARLDRQQEKTTAGLSTNSQSAQVMKINKGSSLIGSTVKNQKGEELGKIRDLVIDFNSGRVAYIVLDSATGLLGPQKLHAVPLRAFQPDPAGTSLVLNADKGKLERSEGFAKDNWPAVTTATWGAEPFWKLAPRTTEPQPQP